MPRLVQECKCKAKKPYTHSVQGVKWWKDVGCDVLIGLTIKIGVFWDATPSII
jgi:hypothetical protein